jgi:hypothetical protein
MTPLERACVCGATYRIETDDTKYAESKMKAWEKKHNLCHAKDKKSNLGHPRTKKGHIKK